MKIDLAHVDEPLAPYPLFTTQNWFGSIIGRQLADGDLLNALGPSGLSIAEEASRYIIPSPTLRPEERIQIYSQQYWWRLLTALHESFPLVTRLFGTHSFDHEIAIPYLLKYPPYHWSLTFLGERLPKWIAEDYHAADQALVRNAINLDWAFNDSFVAAQQPAIDLTQITAGKDFEHILSRTLLLQPHIHLFQWNYDLFTFRHAFIEKEIAYWIENEFPPLPKGPMRYFVLFRGHSNQHYWKELTAGEHCLLSQLKKGATIDEACEQLETLDAAQFEEAEQNIQRWFQEWTIAKWLTLKEQ